MTDSDAPENAGPEFDEAAEERLVDELAPEESLLKDWLPRPTPIDGPAPAP